ncbi:hypothetical protein B484DRAFT_45253 [Ochromonadaceae sp. CCMP2298]|nr:hypothetical protein B484DRAFT_45253 [Ochromonadaceae sp. CCMP2298]
MQWPGESRLQGESMDIIKSLDERYPSPPLYNAHTQTAVAAFRDTFPRNARPSSRSAFLFSNQGDPLPRADFERTLDSVESLLVQGQREGQGEGQRGPFFCGAFSAADCAFAPFLERYAAQLPLLHSGLRVREGGGPRRPRLQAWFAAMDRPPLSFYPARVKGCDESWGRVLGQAGFGNGGIVPQSLSSASTSTSEAATTAGATPTSAPSADAVWRHYAAARAFVAPTARTEVAARIARNAEALVGDMQRTGAGGAGVGADEALRALALRLTRTEGGGGGGVEGVGTGAGTDAGTDTDTLTALAAAEYLHARVCVPRDMGVLPVEALRGELASLRAEAEAGARGVGV